MLFTPAGMNQFKDHFLGKVQARIHPGHDLPEMPAHRRHRQRRPHGLPPHVFRDAGQFQLRRLFQARRDPLGLGVSDRQEVARPRPPIGCSVTVYLDDDEAADIWLDEIKLPPDRIQRLGEDDNFWPASAPSQGPDGVCGPCSEIFFTRPTASEVEIWNLVFTQFNRVGDPPNNLRPLPSKNIDTGMGLERTAAVLQGVDTNFHIDILRPLVEAAGEVCGVKYDPAERKRPPAAPHRRPRPRLHVRHPRKRLSRAEQGEVRHQAAAAPRRARRPSDGRPRAVPAQARAARWPR